jgi:DedD protein
LARPATPEATEIRRRGRQRLIGAVTLVALLVVFVPMFLDNDPRPQREQPVLTIPPKENAKPLPTPTPAVEPAKPAPAKTVAPAAATPVAPPAKPAAPGAAPAAEPAPAISKPGDRGPISGFAVQVGAFRDEAKLKQARDKLVAANVVHYTERLETKSGPLTRLRAGPYETREAAEGALVAIKRGALDGKVVPLP